MAYTYENTVPIAGGGIGNYKVGKFVLDGTYPTGGVSLGITNEPMWIMVQGYHGAWVEATSKIMLTADGGFSGGSVTVPDKTVTGVTAAVGDIVVPDLTVAATNAANILGTVDGTTSTIAIGDADVGGTATGSTVAGVTAAVGDVVVPGGTYTVTGSSAQAPGEIADGTDITGVAILIITR